MTLIAANKISETPIIFGDTLISGPSDLIEPIPTQITHNFVKFFKNADIVPVGFRKKIYIISPNLAVGWTGHLIVAKNIISQIISQFGGKHASLEAFEQFMKQMRDFENNDMMALIIGWLINGENSYCFLWNSSFPGELFYDSRFYVGSGENFAKELMKPLDISSSTENFDSPAEQSIFSSLAKLSTALTSEIVSGKNLLDYFGFVYEVIYFDRTKFKQVNKITYLIWEFLWDPTTKQGRVTYPRTLVGYENHKKYSLVTTIKLRNYPDCDVNTTVIGDIFDEAGSDNNSAKQKTLKADYYCNFINFKSTKGLSFWGPLVVSDETPNQPMWHRYQNNLDIFELDTGFITQMYLQIAKNSGFD